MMRRSTALSCVALVLGPAAMAPAQQWSGILAPARATDWSVAGVTGGIPDRTTICATLSPGATAAQINGAIASCPSGQVVKLDAGTFNLTGAIAIERSDVTLRGQGMSTILNFTSCGSFYWGPVCLYAESSLFIGNWGHPPGAAGVPDSTQTSWTGTNGSNGVYTQGATVLNLASNPGRRRERPRSRGNPGSSTASGSRT